MWVRSCCCRSRTPGSTLRASTSWQRDGGGSSDRALSARLQALKLFEAIDQQRFMALLSEVAAVGQGGLQINEPGTSRSIKTLPGI